MLAAQRVAQLLRTSVDTDHRAFSSFFHFVKLGVFFANFANLQLAELC
jgi:hypothetical protein